MIQELFPVRRPEADIDALYPPGAPAADCALPRLMVNMVASVDGATVVEGVTGALGSPGDKRIFFWLRSLADVILVGAQTVRAEGYGPPRLAEEHVAARVARGQSPLPRIAVVSRSLELDWSARFFTDAPIPPIVVAPASADPVKLRAAGAVADVIVVGRSRVDLREALLGLRQREAGVVLCEGGPTLNGELASAGLIDELYLTVAPALVGGEGGARIVGAADLGPLVGVSLVHVLEEDGSLFLAYRVGRREAGE